MRRIALLDLADLEDEGSLQPIIDALKQDASADVRREAAQVLASWERTDVVEALCGALLDADADVRNTAAQSLSELKDAASGVVLTRWAGHADAFVKASALRALRELRYSGAFDVATQALVHTSAAVRREAVGVLGWLKEPGALDSLASLASADPDPDVRRAAAGALGFASADSSGPVNALLGALHDDAWQVREEAATTLGKLRAPHARDELITSLDDAYWQVRLRAARALGRIGDAKASAPLATLLTHSISNLRKEAALALGELGDRSRLRTALRAALDDRDPDVRKAVRIALQQIESENA